MVELLKLIECVLHGSFQHLGGSMGSGLSLRETPAENVCCYIGKKDCLKVQLSLLTCVY